MDSQTGAASRIPATSTVRSRPPLLLDALVRLCKELEVRGSPWSGRCRGLSEHEVGERRGLVVQLAVGHELVQLAFLAAGIVRVGAEAGVAGDFGALGAGVGGTWAVAEATARGGCCGRLGLGVQGWQPVKGLSLARVLLPQRCPVAQAVEGGSLDGEGAGLGGRGPASRLSQRWQRGALQARPQFGHLERADSLAGGERLW